MNTPRILTGHADGHVAVWERRQPVTLVRPIGQQRTRVRALALSPCHRLLGVARGLFSHTSVAIHDAVTGDFLALYHVPYENGLAWGPVGLTWVAQGKVWVATAKDPPAEVPHGVSGHVATASWDDGGELVIATRSRLVVTAPPSWAVLRVVDLSDPWGVLTVAPRGGVVATTHCDGAVCVDGESPSHPLPWSAWPVAWSGDGRLAVGSADGAVWVVQDGVSRLVARVRDQVSHLEWAGPGGLVATTWRLVARVGVESGEVVPLADQRSSLIACSVVA